MLHSYFLCHLNLPGAGAQYGRPDTGPALRGVASRHGHTFFAMLAEKSKTGGSKVKVGFIQWDVQRELEEEIAWHYERK